MTEPSPGAANATLALHDAGPDDLPGAIELTMDAYSAYASQFPPVFWQQYRANILETLHADSLAQRIIALQDGSLVGSVLLYPPQAKAARPGRHSTGWPEIRLLAVTPAARGRGIARALMEECLRRARAWDAPCLQLHTMDVMHVARGMYERMGFARAPELDFQPADGVAVLGYSLDLRGDPAPFRDPLIPLGRQTREPE